MTECTLGGIPMSAHAPIPWGFETGTDPHQESYEVHVSRAASVFAIKGTTSLEYRRANGTKAQVLGLEIMGEFPTSNPYTRGVLVACPRWRWNRIPVVGNYNERRRTGNVIRLGSKNDVRAALVPEVAYAPWSLKDGKSPWTAEEVLRDVLAQVCGSAFDVSKASFSKQLPIENLEFSPEDGNVAIDRILAYIPGNRIYMDEFGIARVFDATDQSATAAMLPKLERAKVGGGLIRFTSFERTRPGDIHVLFDREPELRLNFTEGTTSSTTDGTEKREVLNVLPCPDVTLDIPAGPWGAARTVNMGTWITFEEFFAAMAGKAPTFFGDKLLDLSHDIVQQLWTSPLLTLLYAGNLVPDPVWDRRIKAVVTHYRQTFQITPRWRDKLRTFRMNRVGIIDPLRGGRAPADVFGNYCVRPTLKRMADQAGEGQLLGWNVFTLSSGGDVTQANLNTATVSNHCEAQTLDVEQGVFRINYKQNLNLDDAQVYPSAVDAIPYGDPSETYLTWEYARLRASHSFSIVFTAMQASPNDLRRFHEIVLTPKDVEGVLGRKIGECNGPSWYIFVGKDTARFTWSDDGSYPSELETAFGVGSVQADRSKRPNLGTPTNDDALQALAKATAASVYAVLLDRYEGSMTVALDPTLRPTGTISGVQHVLTPDGLPVTTITCPPNLAPIDPWAYVPDSVQRKLRGLVQGTL